MIFVWKLLGKIIEKGGVPFWVQKQKKQTHVVFPAALKLTKTVKNPAQKAPGDWEGCESAQTGMFWRSKGNLSDMGHFYFWGRF